MIVAAAIIYDGVVWTLPRPARHCHIMHAMVRVLGWNAQTQSYDPLPRESGIEQGFVDELGAFRTREDAARHVKAFGQPLTERASEYARRGELLFSEDLW